MSKIFCNACSKSFKNMEIHEQSETHKKRLSIYISRKKRTPGVIKNIPFCPICLCQTTKYKQHILSRKHIKATEELNK